MEFTQLVFPAPPASYSVLDPDLIWIPLPSRRSFLRTKAPEHLAAFYVPYVDRHTKKGSDSLVIYFHANAEDLGTSYDNLMQWYSLSKCNVLAMEYPGYGVSVSRKPGEKQVFKDALALFSFATDTLGFPPHKITVVGRSIGTGPASYLASKQPSLRALVLLSPFTSIKAVAKSLFGAKVPLPLKDQFPNLTHIKRLKCPLFVVHGLKDELVPIDHAQMLLSHCTSPQVGFNFPPLMTHNRFHDQQDLIEPFLKFCLANNLPLVSECEVVVLPEEYSNLGLVGSKALLTGNLTCVSEIGTQDGSIRDVPSCSKK